MSHAAVYHSGVLAIAATEPAAPPHLIHATWREQLSDDTATVATRFNGGEPLSTTPGKRRGGSVLGGNAVRCMAVLRGPPVRSQVEAHATGTEVRVWPVSTSGNTMQRALQAPRCASGL